MKIVWSIIVGVIQIALIFVKVFIMQSIPWAIVFIIPLAVVALFCVYIAFIGVVTIFCLVFD